MPRPTKPQCTPIIGALVASMMLVSLAACSNSGKTSDAQPNIPLDAVIATPGIGPPLPEDGKAADPLTDDEKARATGIMFADRLVAQLATPSTSRVSQIGVWSEGDQRIGAVAIITLNAATDFEATWPQVRTDKLATLEPETIERGYATTHASFRKTGVLRLLVLIDLRRNEVAGVQPLTATSGASLEEATSIAGR